MSLTRSYRAAIAPNNWSTFCVCLVESLTVTTGRRQVSPPLPVHQQILSSDTIRRFDSSDDKGNNPLRMLSLEEAIERSLAATPKLGGETISLANAEGRFAASDAKAKVSLPAFDNSAMDGYAVRSCDLKSATADSPVGLMCVGVIPAGTFPAGSLESETCMKIYTGSPIPDGTDAVIMQEDCRSTPGDGATILCNERVNPWENIRLQGEDIREGDTVISNGSRITAGTIGLLPG